VYFATKYVELLHGKLLDVMAWAMRVIDAIGKGTVTDM
jgi:hypothetical protein